MTNDSHNHHISQQFNSELDAVKTHMLEMGGLVEKQIAEAVQSLLGLDTGQAELVKKTDQQINEMEVSIDQECTRILARRQPAASDLRLVLAISKAVSDLERIGDEAGKIASQAMDLSERAGQGDSHSNGTVEIRMIGEHVGRMVRDALDAFARLDADKALAVAQEDKLVDAEYATAMRSVITYMMEDPRSITSMLNVMWSLRSLERVGDHARNIAEHVIYLVKGRDVRHVGLSEMEAHIKNS